MRTREIPKNGRWNIKSKRKSHEKESLQFSTMMRKMAYEWETLVNTSRAKRQIHGVKQQNREKEIQRQERIEWGKWKRERALGY